MTAYLSIDEVLEINKGFVGPDQLRDLGLLEAAVMRPQSSAFGADAFPGLHDKAAALLHGLARNHPFVDGNKRTSWSATAMFYLTNGYALSVRADDVVGLMLDAAEGRCDVADIAATLSGWARRFPQTDDWMDTAPVFSRVRRVDEAQIAELTQSMLHDLERMLSAHGIDNDVRAAFVAFWESLDELARPVEQSIALALPLSAESLKSLRGARQRALDIYPDMPPEWAQKVNAHPLFVMLDSIDNDGQPKKAPGRSKKKPKRRRR